MNENDYVTKLSKVETAPKWAAVGGVPVGRFLTLNKVLL